MSFRVSLLAALLVAGGASAHVSMAGPGFAGTNQLVTFSIGHGCEGADTVGLRIAIPSAVTSVRAMPGPFGEPTLERDGAGLVVAVSWKKGTQHDVDEAYYQHQVRIAVPDAPFTTLAFPATQTCRTKDGVESVVEWDVPPGEEPGEGEEPAPALQIVPPRATGWNKYTAPAEITDLTYFDDALIVWSGTAAYSKNPETMSRIEAEEDVTVLTSIASGAEIWVRY